MNHYKSFFFFLQKALESYSHKQKFVPVVDEGKIETQKSAR